MNKILVLLKIGKIKNNVAKQTLIEMLETGKKVDEILSDDDLKGLSEEELLEICKEAVANNEKAVADYLNGKLKAAKSIVGFVMKQTKGKADAQVAEKLIVNLITKA